MAPHTPLSTAWPLVGRDEVLDTVVTTLRSSPGATVLLCGGAGVGKTRLAATAASILAEDGWFILAVSGNDSISGIPLGAIGPALALTQAQLDEVAHDPVALFQQSRRAVEAAAGGRPVLMVVDDLGQLDGLSLTVIAQLLATNTGRLIATIRSGDPIPDAILSRWASSTATRIDLAPLGVDDLRALLGHLLGPIANRAVVDLHAASLGNPLYLRELVIGAIDDGHLTETDGVWHLGAEPLGTPALHDLIRSRLRHLSASALESLERICVCQPLWVDELVGPDARASVVELETAGIVTLNEAAGRLRVWVTHPQYAAAVRASVSRLRTIDVLLEQAAIVEARNLGAADELRVALWRLDAGQPSDPEFLARAISLAALAQDHPAIARLAAAAIEAGAPRVEMLFLQGQALWTLGRDSEAVPLLDAAADEDTGTSPWLTVQIARVRAGAYWGDGLGETASIRVLDDAELDHPYLSSRLAMPRAQLLLTLDEATLAAAQLEVAPADLEPLSAAIHAMYRSLPVAAVGRTEDSRASAAEAMRFAFETPSDALHVRWAQMIAAIVELQAGNPRESQRLALESLADALDHRDEVAVRRNEFTLGEVALATGMVETAARWFRDVATGAQARGPGIYRDRGRALHALALAWHGDVSAAAAIVHELDPAFLETNSYGQLATAWLQAVTGSRQAATDSLVTFAETLASRGHSINAAALLHAAVRLGSADAAVAPLQELAADGRSPLIAMQYAHAAAEHSGNTEALTSAGAAWESSDHLLYAAEAFASAASNLLRDNRARESAALRERALRLAAQCEGAATPLLQFLGEGDVLTAREREITALAAQGLSSIQIAEKLFLSPRTVNNHLQSAYGKLGIRSRAELRP